MPPAAADTRLPLVDAIKALASQAIVLHHLAWYGPLSEAVHAAAPALIEWLCDYARLAVQAFLVVAGFLAARALAPAGAPALAAPLMTIAKRYVRLAMPYLAAVALAVAAAAAARTLSADDSIPAAPTLPQLLAHALLLQDLLGYDVLSAGVWYVAIDFQLFALFAALLWLAQRCGGGARTAVVLVAALAAASLLHFNRDEDWDAWGIYFFGAYALGALAYWISAAARPRSRAAALLLAGIVVLLVDFRLRIAVALATALALALAPRKGTAAWTAPGVAFLARISYALFLVHYPVSLVVNAVFERIAPGSALVGALGLLCAWAASVAAGAAFHRYVECRFAGRRLRVGHRLSARAPGSAGRAA